MFEGIALVTQATGQLVWVIGGQEDDVTVARSARRNPSETQLKVNAIETVLAAQRPSVSAM